MRNGGAWEGHVFYPGWFDQILSAVWTSAFFTVWKTRFRDASNSTQPVSNWTIWTWLFYEKIVFFPFPFLCAWQPNPLPKEHSCSIRGKPPAIKYGHKIYLVPFTSIWNPIPLRLNAVHIMDYNGIPQDTYPILNPTKPLVCLKMIPIVYIYIFPQDDSTYSHGFHYLFK